MTIRRLWSAARWAQFAQLTYLVGGAAPFVGALVGFVVSVGASPRLRAELIALSSILVIVSICGVAFATVFGSLVVPSRQRSEEGKGITTFRLDGQNLDQVIPGTDTIVRKAGDPYLSQKDYEKLHSEAVLAGDRPDAPPRLLHFAGGATLWILASSLVWLVIVSVAVVLFLGHVQVAIVVAAAVVGLCGMLLVLALSSSRRRSSKVRGR